LRGVLVYARVLKAHGGLAAVTPCEVSKNAKSVAWIAVDFD
jgi:hypothetical protein